MRTWILMLCGVSIFCLASAVWAVDTAPANLGDDVAALPDSGGNPLAGCWHLKKHKYKKGGVVKVKVGKLHRGHDHWLELIDKDGKVVAERRILPDERRNFKYQFKDVDCGGAPHKVRAYGDGPRKCDFTKDVTGRCRRK